MKIKDSESLGQAIRHERKRQKVTQVELAGLAGVGVRFLRELERGKPGCQIGHAFLVLQTLGISIDVSMRDADAK